MDAKGTERTKTFYDEQGWREAAPGKTTDEDLFGVKEDGPLRQAMFERKWDRIAKFLGPKAQGRHVLELGCGGTPEMRLFDFFDRYTGSDFSSLGLAAAQEKAMKYADRAEFVEADAVNLPFRDDCFDAVYCAHMIYHIEDRAAQMAAIAEMLRVLKPGGQLVLETANPRPILFPVRAIIRIISDTPVLGSVARQLKGQSPIPYSPSRIAWYRRRLAAASTIRIVPAGMASTKINQRMTEYRYPWKWFWQIMDRLEDRFPTAACHLGNYLVFLINK